MPDPRPLAGRTIAITEHRLERELASLIERRGGRVVSCPLLEERPTSDVPQLDAFVREVIEPGLDMMVFFTGVGFRFLYERALAMRQGPDFLEGLRRTRVVARGPKPRAALRKVGLRVDLAPEDPTSEGLLELLGLEDLAEKRVGVQLYGTPNESFCDRLEDWGAKLRTVQVYEYRAASDTERVGDFITRLLSGEVDVVTFTSAPQVSALFSHATRIGRDEELVRAMRETLVVAAIGRVTNRALEERGCGARIIPASSKLAPMVEAIARCFEEGDR
jgi:uroporphyrinogen-III synthase